MRRVLLTSLLMLLATPVLAGEAEFDIRLGKEPTAPRATDPARIAAVDRFLSARQAGSHDASQRGAARSLLAAKADDEALFGPRRGMLVAYDFHDRAIEAAGAGGFQVRVYLLFADRDGVVIESRNETLAFAARGGGYVCTAVKPTGTMIWERNGLEQTAGRLEASEALARAENALHAWAARHRGGAAYSVADIERSGDGRVHVQCRRFIASRGRRGFDAQDSTLVLIRDGSGYRVESN